MSRPKCRDCVIIQCPVLPRRASIRGELHHDRLQGVFPDSEPSFHIKNETLNYHGLFFGCQHWWCSSLVRRRAQHIFKAGSSVFRRHVLILLSVDLSTVVISAISRKDLVVFRLFSLTLWYCWSLWIVNFPAGAPCWRWATRMNSGIRPCFMVKNPFRFPAKAVCLNISF